MLLNRMLYVLADYMGRNPSGQDKNSFVWMDGKKCSSCPIILRIRIILKLLVISMGRVKTWYLIPPPIDAMAGLALNVSIG